MYLIRDVLFMPHNITLPMKITLGHEIQLLLYIYPSPKKRNANATALDILTKSATIYFAGLIETTGSKVHLEDM